MSDIEEFSEVEYSTSSSDDDFREELVESFSKLEPYRFEPRVEYVPGECRLEPSDCSSEETKNCKNRSGCLKWCSCSQCHIEEREIDCLCCKEVPALEENKFEGFNCVIQAAEFRLLCLTRSVLQNVLVGLNQTRGDHLESCTSNRSFRYAAYRQFTWWIYRKLGKGMRRVIPSCVLWAIRGEFPESGGQYVNYEEGETD